MLTVSGKCMCDRCEGRTQNIYRMIGHCRNCGATPILMIFRAGDKTHDLDCPLCENWHCVHPDRLATDEEIPVA